MFKRVEYQVLEVERGTKLPELTTDLKEGIRALTHVPAFQYIMMKLRYDRAMVEKYLRDGFELPEGQLRSLQAGIYWLQYLEREISTLTKSIQPPRPAEPNESNEFQEMQKSIELIS